MASYTVEWKNSARRELRRRDRSVIPHIVEAVGQLAEEPLPAGCRKLTGSDHTYRIRVGDYRVVYEIVTDARVVQVVRVRHRREAYR